MEEFVRLELYFVSGFSNSTNSYMEGLLTSAKIAHDVDKFETPLKMSSTKSRELEDQASIRHVIIAHCSTVEDDD